MDSERPGSAPAPFRVLVVDDEPIVHTLTAFVLEDMRFDRHPVEMISAQSLSEAKAAFQSHERIAVALVDLAMGSDLRAGLELVRWIREELRDRLVRIVLRTQRTALLPEHDAITRYEINDYRDKMELSDTELLSVITGALRGYVQVHDIDLQRRGLERVVQGQGGYLGARNTRDFAAQVLRHLLELMQGERKSLAISCAVAALSAGSSWRVVDSVGAIFHGLQRITGQEILQQMIGDCQEGILRPGLTFGSNGVILLLDASNEQKVIAAVCTRDPLTEVDQSMLRAAANNISLAAHNLNLSLQMEREQQEMIMLLGELVEGRSHETGNHVRRVGSIVSMLAEHAGISSQQCQTLNLAASLHDVGKIAIPDDILNKPGKLTETEFEQMKAHTLQGHRLLSARTEPLMREAAIIARSHHERWDGAGYPDGLMGESIDPGARMTGIADVFDALTHKRAYKPAWTPEEAFTYICERAGTAFDPHLVDRFVSLRADILDLIDRYPD